MSSKMSGKRGGLLGIAALWGACEPIRRLLCLLAFQIALSAGYINYFCRSFDYGRLLIPIHCAVAAAVIALTAVCPGFMLLSRRVRAFGFTRFFLALVAAAGFCFLLALYLADLAGNVIWGNNISRKLVEQYAFHWPAAGQNSISISRWVYIGLAAALAAIIALYLRLSRMIQTGLEELFLPGRECSLFKDRRRAAMSTISLSAILIGYAGGLAYFSRQASRGGLASREPIMSFFIDANDIYDLNGGALAERLRREEPLARAAYGTNHVFQKKNVVIIIIDSLRADHMQVYGYGRPTTPFLTQMVKDGRIKKVDFATSTCAESNCGILSTMSSKPLRGIVPQDFKLYDLLHDQGYNTDFILSGNHDWYGLKDSYGKQLTYYFDGADSHRYGWNDDRLIFEGLEGVPAYAGTPTFFYFHLMSVHLLGNKLEQYRRYNPSAVKNDWSGLFGGQYDAETVTNNYDNGVIQADAIVEQIFDWLRQQGYLSNGLAVILADHGEGLGERGSSSYGHVMSLYQEFIRIPMLIYDNSNARYANLSFATQIDVSPTIVDRLGLPIPKSWEGRSLLNPDVETYNFHQTRIQNPCYALLYRTDQAIYKYIYWTVGKQYKLYELISDPGETNDLTQSADPRLLEQLQKELEANLAQ
jgi:glucan phosphoethanolaminetransferase (alkaline phosphatase superfamily)